MQEIFDEKSVDEKVKSNKLEKNMNGKIKDRVNSQKNRIWWTFDAEKNDQCSCDM
jgi:hypothetical protein